MTKEKAAGLGVIGILLMIGSLVSLRYPDVSQWFPVLLLFGGVMTWVAIGRYRAA
jgi:hypothetical protein